MARALGSPAVPARRKIAVALAAASISLLLHACGGEERFAERICPRVQLLEYADRLTEFAPGAGRDLTDVVLTGRLVNIDGECNVEDDRVELDLTVRVSCSSAVRRTGAAKGGSPISWRSPSSIPPSAASASFRSK